MLVTARKGNLTLTNGYVFAGQAVMTKWTRQGSRPVDPEQPEGEHEPVAEQLQATDVTFFMLDSEDRRADWKAEDIIARHTVRVEERLDAIAAAYGELAKWRGSFGDGWTLSDQRPA